MKRERTALSRRELLAGAGWLTLAGVAGAPRRLLAADLATLDVAYAGSMGSLMEGSLKTAVARTLKLDMHGRAQGSSALAQLIVGGSISPDVFIPITPGPMLTVLRAGKAEIAHPFAHTEMVLAYSPKSRFAASFDAAAKGKGNWWEVLQEPGLRFGRTDPVIDPQGRNIIFTMMLAARLYKQADLVEKVLGETINKEQIFTEPTVQARLQSGELDAASAYKIQPGPFNLPYVVLPAEINLSGQNVHAANPDLSLSVGGKTFVPEPLIYYAAALKGARNAEGAAAFIQWLQGGEAQSIFRHLDYDPAGDASELHA
jgi:molybdate/tungstate transport system substrate-binding protein